MNLRITYRHHIVACFVLPWAVGLLWLAFLVTTPSPEEAIAIEHEKLRHMLEQLDQAERALQSDVGQLEAFAPGIDYNNLYQRLDLSTLDGINTARHRATTFGTQMDNFAKKHEQFWAKVKAIVANSDLNESLQSQIKAQLTLDQTDVYPKYRAWTAAARDDVQAVEHYLDLNERYLGQFKLIGNSLTFTDPKVAAALSKAQTALVNAEEHYHRAARSALQNHDNTTNFVASAMRGLERGMTRHESRDEETGTEKKPQ